MNKTWWIFCMSSVKGFSMKECFIYGLVDPRTNEVRYIGWATNPKKRFREHILSRDKSRKVNWIKQLYNFQMKPELIIIESNVGHNYAEREIYWIAYYRSIGCDLTNMTNGGDGTLGLVHSDETKEKIRQKTIGNKRNQGRIHSDEARLNMSDAAKKRGMARSVLEKAWAACRGRNITQDHIDSIKRATMKPVIRLDDGVTFESIGHAADAVGIDRSTIGKAIKNKKRSAGYYWAYYIKDEEND